jgi:serine/threonine protein kinase/Tol biopolymer transport system component
MTISAGTRLGSYELLVQIGAGGMGEVYQAHDTKLGRDVAIKVLPEAFAHDAERLARFQREAKMLAALNHPNIATIYGLEHSNSTHFLIMELVSGDTLAERIKRDGDLPVEEALKIVVQIAEALEAAHEKGIIHRDLKPANVKVTPEGKVKVLDFGLAKAFAADAVGSDPSESPTLSRAATMQGAILGTAAYMSPEQARSKEVDKRADIWAFGCVLYELLTGKQAFQGETVTEILAAVLKTEPDWQGLPPATPLQIRSLLRRCLQKDKALRMRDAGDARIEIHEALAEPGAIGVIQAKPVYRTKVPWAMAATIVATVALLGWWRSARPIEKPVRPLVQLDVDLGPDVSLGSPAGIDVSPDGTRLVYVSQPINTGGAAFPNTTQGRLFTRRLDQPNATELAGTQGAYAPFFSQDGQWVAFFAQGKLKKISVDGGAAITLSDASSAEGGSWGEDGNIIAALGAEGGLFKIASGGGAPEEITGLQPGEVTHRWPQVLPGAKAVLFTSRAGYRGEAANALLAGGFDDADIEVISLPDHHRKTLVRGGTFGRYLPSGHLVYVSRGTLFAVPFDLERLELRGVPVAVLEEVDSSTVYGSAQLAFSQTGTVVYRSIGEGGLMTVQWLDATGKTQPLLAKPGSYLRPSLSPDGTRLAIASSDIWVYDWRRDTMTRLTFGATAVGPIWSPDGRYILFQAPGGMFWTRSDGSGKSQLLTQSNNAQIPWSITADGKRLAFHENQTSINIWTVALENEGTGLRAGKPEVFSQTRFDEMYPSFSPDGRWLAYASNESGMFQVYVRAFPGKEGKWQISNSGGVVPEWAHNGNELFFRTLDNQIMTARYSVRGDSFVAEKPRVWSDKRIADVGGLPNYGLAPDGKRIAALMPAETPQAQMAQNHVIFLENFFDELRRRVPTGK